MLDIILNSLQGLLLIKIAFLILNAIYILFLIVVYKQSRAMQRVINDTQASSLLNSIALLNIVVAFSLFVTALIIL